MRLLPSLLALLLPFTLASAAGPATSAGGKTVRLLTVGNSFSQNATHYLPDIVAAAGDQLIIHRCDVGGSPLELHWNKVLKFEADPKDKEGRYTTGRSLQEELKSEKWDFVTIQQYSMFSHDVKTYQPFATNLRDYIKKNAPTAEVIMQETWPYRKDDPRFSAKSPKAGEPHDQAEMYAMVSSAYRTVAKELGLRLLPVGDAFNMANNDPAWGYQAPSEPVSVASFQYPALPLQVHSLNKGYNWKKGTDGKWALGMDGHHASTAGEYLGGCIWFEVMYQQSCLGNSFLPPGLSKEDAAYLQKTAHAAVEAESKRK